MFEPLQTSLGKIGQFKTVTDIIIQEGNMNVGCNGFIFW